MYQAQRMQTTMDMALSALLWKGNPELDPSESGFLFNEERQAWEFGDISQEDRDVFLPPRCNCKKGAKMVRASAGQGGHAQECPGVCFFLRCFLFSVVAERERKKGGNRTTAASSTSAAMWRH